MDATTDWAVTLDVVLLEGVTDDEDTLDAAADAAMDLFEDLDGGERGCIVSVEVDHLSLTLTAYGDTIRTGLEDAVNATTMVFDKLGYETEVTGVHVRSYEALEAEGDRYAIPPLVGVAEVAEMLDVSKARVGELARDQRLPRAVARLAAGPVWVESEVLSFAESRNRRPGRPAAAAARVDA